MPARRPRGGVPAGPDFFRFADEDEAKRRLTGAGLADPRVETLRFAHRLESPAELRGERACNRANDLASASGDEGEPATADAVSAASGIAT